MLKLKLHWQILIALILAILYGLYLTDYAYLVTWMGDLFLRALKMIIIPLILTSIISGVTSIGDAQNLGRLGLKTITYYISTSLFAIVTGLVFVNLIQPGVGADLGLKKEAP
jgi:proton glutamate symport protein